MVDHNSSLCKCLGLVTMETCTIFSTPVAFFSRLGEGERKVYRFDRIILLRSQPSTSLLNRDGMCRHFQSALLKKIADGNNYVKEGLFSKLVFFRFFSSERTKSFGSKFLQNDIGRPC